jgi:AcrR family transcriptional regulator
MVSKRQKILNSALVLFVKQGFHGTPTSLIATHAGISNGTLFHYFATKEELIISLYLETKDKFLIRITETFDKSAPFREKIKFIWEQSVRWAMENPNDFRFIQQYHSSPYIVKLTGEQLAGHAGFFLALFEEGQKEGWIRKMDPEILFQISSYHIFGFIYYLFDHPETLKDPHMLSAVFACYWDSIRQHEI